MLCFHRNKLKDSKNLKIQRKSNKISIMVVLIVLFSSFLVNFVYSQSEISFKTADEFKIPNTNGSIKFSVDGRYEKASLENNTWSFINLQLNNTPNEEKLSLKVLAKDCCITITSIRIYNRSIGSETVKRSRLSYDLLGDGTQIFDLGLDPNMGDWGVRFDQVYIAENKGWSLSSQGTLTINGKAKKVSLSYYGLPDSMFNQSFINQHSVIIIVALTAVVAIAISMVIKRRKKIENDN